MEGIDSYESRLLDRLVELCNDKGFFKGILPSSPDIQSRWDVISLDYSPDAIREFNAYPEVVLAWAAYIGSAVAFWWDKDWDRYKENGYESLKGSRGFDDLDEHVTKDILGIPLKTRKAVDLAEQLSFLASAAYSFMLHQPVERQSVEAFSIFRQTLSAMYRIGAAVELNSLGYSMQAL